MSESCARLMGLSLLSLDSNSTELLMSSARASVVVSCSVLPLLTVSVCVVVIVSTCLFQHVQACEHVCRVTRH